MYITLINTTLSLPSICHITPGHAFTTLIIETLFTSLLYVISTALSVSSVVDRHKAFDTVWLWSFTNTGRQFLPSSY